MSDQIENVDLEDIELMEAQLADILGASTDWTMIICEAKRAVARCTAI